MSISEKEPAKITLNGQDRLIKIEKVTVMAEGAYVLDIMDMDNIITIDIGAGTVNVVQWKNMTPLPNSYATVPKSFNMLYREIANNIRVSGRGTVTPAYIEETLGQDIITIDGKEVDISDTKESINNFVTGLVANVYDICDVPQANKIIIFGGGAKATEDYWKDAFGEDRLGVTVLENSQFTNSEVFQKAVERLK